MNTVPHRWTLATKALPWALLCLGLCGAAEAVRYASRPAAEPGALALALAVGASGPMLGATSGVTTGATSGATPGPLLAASAAPSSPPRLALRSASKIPMPAGVPSAHASALVALDDGEVLAFWWAGARESGADVAIYLARWKEGRWSEAQRIVERGGLGRQLGFGVRRLGNPTAWVARDGRIHLYAVATGLGGWAASRIVHLVSLDRGHTFNAVRVLALSPLFNTSFLVRANSVGLADGGWLLPAYFELGHKYPLVMAMDAQGAPLWSQRIGASTTTLQPALLPVSSTEIHALMRDHGAQRRLQRATSVDAGRNWRDAPALGMVNDDSSVAAIPLAEGGFVMAHNDQLATPATARQWLRLSTSADAQTWHAALDVRRGARGEEFSYPSLLRVGSELHVTFTELRGAIGHHVYDIVPGARVRQESP